MNKASDKGDAFHCDECGKVRDASRLRKINGLYICQWCR